MLVLNILAVCGSILVELWFKVDNDALQLAHLRGVLSYILASVAACLSLDLVTTISCLSRKIPDTLQVMYSSGFGETPKAG